MSFKPGEKTESKQMDISASILKSATKTTGRLGNFSSSAGKTNELELPIASPLIFPALDHAAAEGNTGGFKLFKKTAADYMDRRAQAKWVCYFAPTLHYR